MKNPLWLEGLCIVGRCPVCGERLVFDTSCFRATAYCRHCDHWYHTGVIA